MARFLNCCLTAPASTHSQVSRDAMEKPSNSNAGGNCMCEKSNEETNVILNHDFSEGLRLWHPNCCEGTVVSSESGYLDKLNGPFAVITNRKECWQGLEQDITTRVFAGCTYTVSAWVGISAGAPQDVQATLKLEHEDSSVSYLFLGKTSASMDHWEKINGTFSLTNIPQRVTFYLEGPSSGIDLLVKSVVVSGPSSIQCDTQGRGSLSDDDANIIQNPQFDDGLNNWSGRGCTIELHDSMGDGKIVPKTGKSFVSTKNRTDYWHGIQQDITGRLQRKTAYDVFATVRILGNNVKNSGVRATLYVKGQDQRDHYYGVGSVQATDQDWLTLQGKFLLNDFPLKVVIYLEGPAPGTDILLDNLVVQLSPKPPPSFPPIIENPEYGVNIIANSTLSDSTNGFFSLGNCTLSVENGSPHFVPPMAEESLGPQQRLSGRYILVSNRTQTWMGPAQMITNKIKLYLTYQVSAWVKIGTLSAKSQRVNVALGVDGQWVNGGQVEIVDDTWHEIGGSFRVEKQPAKVMVYVQGPDPGVDFMVAALQIFPVDRCARFRRLKQITEKIRKRDVTLKFTSTDSGKPVDAFLIVKQKQNSFPFGSCISRTNIDNEDFVDFFTKNFNWGVFGNELKWYWTEAQQGNFNYQDADDMLKLCTSNNIKLRGHCIFWEVESAVQTWVRGLSKNDLTTAVQNRLTSLLNRYKGKFQHYDVNNEMMHGSFFQDRLGKDIRSYMFKTANQLDPTATLFVNDYHVEDFCDSKSSPEVYIRQILDLWEQGAPVGGIGIQGHIDSPVGAIVCSALDKLGVLGLPIWFTELDVSSNNEFVRADDLEVMLRETFAHPAVEGLVMWGFWELFMSRDNAYLVNVDGEVNEAGKRYLALKKEWMSSAHGHVDDNGEFRFRGFHGMYEVEISMFSTVSRKKVSKTIVVEPGEDPVVISIDL